MFRYALIVCCLAAWNLQAQTFETSGQCGDFPAIPASMLDGLCLGLVYQGSLLKKPRQIISWSQNQFLITDMGGWVSGKGSLWLFDLSEQQLRPLLRNLNLPHGIVKFSDNQILLGERDQVSRLTFDANFELVDQSIIVKRNDFGAHRHPLSSFILDEDKNLILNFGAPSDQCLQDLSSEICTQRKEHAQVRRYSYDQMSDLWSADFQVLGFGLRNSMALAIYPKSNTILQAENGMDFNRVHSPFETLNILSEGKDFGWPYCHSLNQPNSSWIKATNCKDFDQPVALLPPHGAPLDMLYYQGDIISFLANKLIVPLHSYQKTGHRILAVSVDKNGVPITNNSQQYQLSRAEPGYSEASFPNGMGAKFDYLVSDIAQDIKLTVSGITQLPNGTLLLIDDINKAILILAKQTESKMPDETSGLTLEVSTETESAVETDVHN